MKINKVATILATTLVFTSLCVGCGSKDRVEEIIGTDIGVEVSTESNGMIEKEEKTVKATSAPTTKPNTKATMESGAKPTAAPSLKSTAAPTAKPVATAAPTAKPTAEPTANPVETEAPTAEPVVCEHDYKLISTYYGDSPSCGCSGWGTFQCQKCGDKYGDEVPPTGLHNYVIEKEHGEAECAQSRWIMWICTYCLDRYTEDIYDPNNHVEDGTCYDALGNCFGCGAHIADVVCQHEFSYSERDNWWWCTICDMGYPDPSEDYYNRN